MVRFRKGAPVQEANSNASKILGSHSGSQVGFGSGQPSAVAQIVISGTLWYSIVLGISLPSLRRGHRRSLRTFHRVVEPARRAWQSTEATAGSARSLKVSPKRARSPALTGESETAVSGRVCGGHTQCVIALVGGRGLQVPQRRCRARLGSGLARAPGQGHASARRLAPSAITAVSMPLGT